MSRLRKLIMFRLAQETGRDRCFQCGELIETPDEFSIDHMKPWLDASPDLFWDVDNIAFSHLACNSLSRRWNGPEEQPICRCGQPKGLTRSGKMRDRCSDCQSERLKAQRANATIGV